MLKPWRISFNISAIAFPTSLSWNYHNNNHYFMNMRSLVSPSNTQLTSEANPSELRFRNLFTSQPHNRAITSENSRLFGLKSLILFAWILNQVSATCTLYLLQLVSGTVIIRERDKLDWFCDYLVYLTRCFFCITDLIAIAYSCCILAQTVSQQNRW